MSLNNKSPLAKTLLAAAAIAAMPLAPAMADSAIGSQMRAMIAPRWAKVKV